MSIRPAGYVCSNERIKKAQGDGQSIDLIGQGNQDDKCWSNTWYAWLREDQFIYWINYKCDEIFQDYVYTNNAIYGISHPP